MEKKYTKIDLLLAKRKGYISALYQFTSLEFVRIVELANAEFSLPTKTVIREEPDPVYTNSYWKFEDGTLFFFLLGEWIIPDSNWYMSSQGAAERFALWADLAKNPTKEVEDDS